MLALRLAYESCKDRFDEPITYNDFLELTKEWEVIPVYVCGECAGAILCKDKEVHACIIEKHHKKWLNKLLYKRIFIDRLAEYGELFTGVKADNAIGKAFVERCGFTVYDNDANVVIYRLGG